MNRQTITKFLLVILAISMVSFGKENLHLEREKAANQSSCLLEGNDDYSIHLFRGGIDSHTDGYVIAHISHKTNKITWLYCSGLSEEPTRRVSYSIKRFRGIIIHKNYLYILAYESSRFSTDKPNIRPGPLELRSYLQKVALHGRFKMIVFNNENGEKVGEYTYYEPIYKPPSIDLFYSDNDHLGQGPISIYDKSIECFGVTFTIEGNKLVTLNPSIPESNTGALVFSILDVNIVPSSKIITLALEFKTQGSQVSFDTYFPEYHISFNGNPFIDLGPVKWRHPFSGNDLKTISVESPYIMTYYFDIPYLFNEPYINTEKINTIRMRVIRHDRNEELVKELKRIGHQNPDIYKNAWFGQVTSQEFIIKTAAE